MIAFSLREVIRDAANTEKIPLTVLKAHLVCLDDLYAFTSSTTFAPSSPNSSVKLDINSSERERAAEVCCVRGSSLLYTYLILASSADTLCKHNMYAAAWRANPDRNVSIINDHPRDVPICEQMVCYLMVSSFL